jgi:hypothetical protein
MNACSQAGRSEAQAMETRTSRNDGRSRRPQKEDATGAPKKTDEAAPANLVLPATSEPAVSLPLALHLAFTGAAANQDASGSDTNNSTRVAAPPAAPTHISGAQGAGSALAAEVRRSALEMQTPPPETAGGGAAVEDASSSNGEIAFAARVTPSSKVPDSPLPNTRLSIQSPLPATSSHTSAQAVPGANSAQAGGTRDERGGQGAKPNSQAAENSTEPARKPGQSAAVEPATRSAVIKNDVKAASEASAAKDQSTLQYSSTGGVSATWGERHAATGTREQGATETSAVHPADNDLKTIQANASSVRNLAVNISDFQKNDVQVRFSEVGGEVRVSVRSSDPQINNQMRDSLPDLVGRFAQTGHEAETWKPAEASSTGSDQGSARNSAGNQDSSDHSGHQQNQNNRGQQGGDSRQEPQWLVELESNMKSGPIQTRKGL